MHGFFVLGSLFMQLSLRVASRRSAVCTASGEIDLTVFSLVVFASSSPAEELGQNWVSGYEMSS